MKIKCKSPLFHSIIEKVDEQLDKVVIQLPTEANEALTAIAAGYSLDEVFREFDKSIDKDQKIDTEDFEAALENSDTKQRFFVAEDDLVLQEILKAPLEKWRVFLHPSQRHLVTNNWNGPVRVLGGAGTGKTVVAIHRAKWLVENLGKDNAVAFPIDIGNPVEVKNTFESIKNQFGKIDGLG